MNRRVKNSPFFQVKLITKIKALRAGKRQVWPGKRMEQRAWDGMEPASVFCALESGRVKKRAGEMEFGKGLRNETEPGFSCRAVQPGL